MLYRLPNYFFNSVFFAVSMPGSGEFSFCSQFYLEKPLTKAISYDILITEQRKREMRCTPLIWLHQKTYAEKDARLTTVRFFYCFTDRGKAYLISHRL